MEVRLLFSDDIMTDFHSINFCMHRKMTVNLVDAEIQGDSDDVIEQQSFVQKDFLDIVFCNPPLEVMTYDRVRFFQNTLCMCLSYYVNHMFSLLF